MHTPISANKATCNKVYLDNGITKVEVIGGQTGGSISQMGEKINALIQQLRADREPVLILNDLKRIGNTTSEAMRNVAILIRVLDYDRACMVGDGSKAMRIETNMLLRAVGRNNTRYFVSLKAAQDWLNREREDPV